MFGSVDWSFSDFMWKFSNPTCWTSGRQRQVVCPCIIPFIQSFSSKTFVVHQPSHLQTCKYLLPSITLRDAQVSCHVLLLSEEGSHQLLPAMYQSVCLERLALKWGLDDWALLFWQPLLESNQALHHLPSCYMYNFCPSPHVSYRWVSEC